MSISEKLPLINSSNKIVKIVGYAVYAFVFLIILGAILPSDTQTNSIADEGSASSDDSSDADVSESSNELSHYGFGNYTFDGQDEVRATVKKGTDIFHMMAMEDLPIDYGYTKDSASYTVTSSGKHIKGYIDYTGDGYGVIMKPKRTSLTKDEFIDIMNTFERV